MFRTDVAKRYKRSLRRKIINICKYYQLEDNLEILSFNKRFSDYKLRWVLMKKCNLTKRFLRAISERIQNNSNVIIVIFGTPNSGKSEGAQTIAFFIKYCLWRTGKRANIHLAFSTSDFQSILTEMDIGDIGIRDESSKESGIGSKNNQKYLDNITKAIRQDQNSFIFVDPTIIEPDVVYFFLESAGKRSFHKCNNCNIEYENYKPPVKQGFKKDNRKFCPRCKRILKLNYSKCKIRFILYDSKRDYLGHIYIPLHWSKRYREKYKEKKNANLDDLKANAGMVTPEIDGKRLERDTNILLKLCNKNGVQRKGEIQALIVKYNSEQMKKQDMIKGDGNYMKVLISNVYREIRQYNEKKYIEKEQQEVSNIKFEERNDFADFCRNNIDDEITANIAYELVKGYSLREILSNNPKLGHYKIQNTSRYLRNVNSPNNLGFLFERWYALKSGVPKEKLKEVLGGSSSKPDLIWDGIVYSLKFRLDLKAKSLKFRQSIDLAPEYKYAKENGVNYKLVFMNPAWDQRIQVIDVDPIKDNEDIVVKKLKNKEN